uniref:Putative DNA polymerase III, chi subunit n=1 Tax=Magnetococcus massalia (strain MO-1) TaxID=451514 RepID=A0A1S7LLI3_MAGMO|nr:putative DNA polymerase III, chi subunit [Candidatus Magnetococcus massalia]
MARLEQGPLKVRFYQLATDTRERALLKIVHKVYGLKMRCCLVAESAEQAKWVDDHLWRYPPDSFLPHGMAHEEMATEQPILISDQPQDSNGATVVVMLGSQPLEKLEQFDMLVDFVPSDDESRRGSRLRYKHYLDAGCTMEYWIQDAKGGWAKHGD